MTGEEAKWAGLGPEEMEPETQPARVDPPGGRQKSIAVSERPFFNFICDERSWGALLEAITVKFRFSRPDKYEQPLIDKHGRPLFLRGDGFDCHVYPPGRKEG
jgi:hypothetical protein